MLFNRETDYAVRVLKNLSTDRPTSISSFVEGEFISEAIAYKVSRKLDKAGIIYGAVSYTHLNKGEFHNFFCSN